MKKVMAGIASAVVAFSSFGRAQNHVSTGRPKLVVAIIIDQFRYDYTTRFRSRYHGGLAQLLDKGAVFVDAHQDHYPTVTATGHATFLSGSVPATSGIVGNEWLDRQGGKTVTSVEDGATKLVGVEGDRTGSSPHNLIISTLGDEIKMAGFGESKTIGISMKDRAAILPGGHMADASYWFDGKTGNVVSSTYYMQHLPAWVKKFNDEQWPQKSTGAKWYAVGQEKGAGQPLMTLPAATDSDYLSKWEETPYSNQALEELAERAIESEGLGHHPATDLLTVSFSANDHIGHAVGPDAPEVQDISVRTDMVLAKLLKAAEGAAGGKQNLVVVLSADHGVAPVPEVMERRKMPAGRIDRKQFTTALSEGLVKRFGAGSWILGSAEGGVYVNYELAEEKKIKLDDIEDQIALTALKQPGVARTYTGHELLEHVAAASPMDELVERGFYRERSPDVIIVMQPYYLFGKEGTSHGTPYNYDTHVPLIFYGGNIRAGTYYEKVGISDVAPTLAALLQVQTPSGSIGHILPEILSGQPIASRVLQ